MCLTADAHRQAPQSVASLPCRFSFFSHHELLHLSLMCVCVCVCVGVRREKMHKEERVLIFFLFWIFE